MITVINKQIQVRFILQNIYKKNTKLKSVKHFFFRLIPKNQRTSIV